MDGETTPQEPFSERNPGGPGQQPDPEPVRNAEDPSRHAYLTITPTTVMPASQAHMLLMSVTGIAGILGAVFTAYIAAHAPVRESDWLLGFTVAELALAAVAELALALTVVLRLRITRGRHGAPRRRARFLPQARPLPPGRG